jgi:hypothetical protein
VPVRALALGVPVPAPGEGGRFTCHFWPVCALHGRVVLLCRPLHRPGYMRMSGAMGLVGRCAYTCAWSQVGVVY